MLLFPWLKLIRLFYALGPTTDTRGHRQHRLFSWWLICVPIIFFVSSGHVLCIVYPMQVFWISSIINMTSISHCFDGLIKNQTELSACDSNIIYSTLFQLPWWTLQDFRYYWLKLSVHQKTNLQLSQQQRWTKLNETASWKVHATNWWVHWLMKSSISIICTMRNTKRFSDIKIRFYWRFGLYLFVQLIGCVNINEFIVYVAIFALKEVNLFKHKFI